MGSSMLPRRSRSDKSSRAAVWPISSSASPLVALCSSACMTLLHAALFLASALDSCCQVSLALLGASPRRDASSFMRFRLVLTPVSAIDTGTGSFGRVRLVKHIKTGRFYALKMLSKALVLRTKQLDHILCEKHVLDELSFPFIVNMYTTFQDENYLYMVLEYSIGGEFFTHLRKAQRFANDTARFYAAGVVLTFEYLHNRNVIYRDLKPENLLLDATGHLKICDFGFSKKVDPGSNTWTLCGTPEYLAPEIILNKGHGKAVDWWALGILIFEMLAGYPPFYSDDRMQLYQTILSGKIEFPRHFKKEARDLISRLLTAVLSYI